MVCVAMALGFAPAMKASAQATIQSSAAIWVGNRNDDYIRLSQLTGAVALSSRMLRPLEGDLDRSLADSVSPQWNPRGWLFEPRKRRGSGPLAIRIFDPDVRLTENTRLPFGGNDAALWQGRGLNTSVTAGVSAEYGPLTVRLVPQATYSQNADFQLDTAFHPAAGVSPFADPFAPQRIDQPSRFGTEPLRELHWGQSAVVVRGFGARAAFGTESMWWGPGMEHSLLMTNNAPGFRHFSIGTDGAIDAKFFDIELLYVLGALDQSDYAQTGRPDTTNRRYVNALMFAVQPHAARGLYVGLARLYYAYVPSGGLTFREVRTMFEPFAKVNLITEDNPGANDRRDQMITAWMRWVFPESRFEVYGELGRNDHAATNRDLISEPGHASAYVLGMQKLFPTDGGFVRLFAETADLKISATSRLRDTPSWYAHHIVQQGYTQRGQVIGSFAGPGGDAQVGMLEMIKSTWSAGLFLRRQQTNADAYWARHASRPPSSRPVAAEETFFGWGLQGSRAVGRVDFSASAGRSTIYNRHARYGNAANTRLEFAASWRLD